MDNNNTVNNEANRSKAIKAAEIGDINEINRLISSGLSSNRILDPALELASSSGHLDVVMALIDGGANIDSFNGQPLLNAVRYNHNHIVEYLAVKGADVNVNEGYTLRYLAEVGELELVKLLIAHGADLGTKGSASVCTAAGCGHIDVVEELVNAGASITDKALRFAAMDGQLEMVEYLIEKKPDLHKNGSLAYAVKNGFIDIAEHLIGCGGDLKNINQDASVILSLIEDQQPGMVEFLINNGANPFIRSEGNPGNPFGFDGEVSDITDALSQTDIDTFEIVLGVIVESGLLNLADKKRLIHTCIKHRQAESIISISDYLSDQEISDHVSITANT